MNDNGYIAYHKDFESIFQDIKRAKIGKLVPSEGSTISIDDFFAYSEAKVDYFDDEIKSLDPSKGKKAIEEFSIGGFDESFAEFSAIEGSIFNTAYSYVHLTEDDWRSYNWLSNHFISRSKLVADKSEKLIHNLDPNSYFKQVYAKERADFLVDAVPPNTILFFDGPIIGNQITHYTMDMVDKLQAKKIFPVFFVKNSNSNMVTDEIKDLKHKFNSDIHWANETLKVSQCSQWFHYEDRVNNKNQKLFCYLKSFNDVSAQRIEMHPSTYHYLNNEVEKILNMIIYLMFENGDKRNPQVRPIAIAEKYARETRKYSNVQKLMKESGLIPTMNEGRGFN